MEYRKTIIILMVAIFIFSITAVSASDMNDTAIDNDNTNQIELSTDDNIIEYKAVSIAEDTQLTQSNNDEKISAENKLNKGTYSDLRNEIRNGGNISLTKNYYCYVDGDGKEIKIITPGVIDGKGAVIDMTGINMHTFWVNTNGVEFKNLTIKNTDFAGFGGAIMFTSSYSGTVTNCNFINHIGNGGTRGGAVYFGHSGTVINCNFTNNKAGHIGGAVYFGHSGTVINCNFTNNNAIRKGGAIYCEEELNIKNCLFDSNQATGKILDNLIEFQQYCGGAVYAGSVIIDSSRFSNNYAEDYGGAIYAEKVTLTDNASYFVDNAVEEDDGGAIYTNIITNDVVYNAVFLHNDAAQSHRGYGGAIYINKENHITFSNCVFANNLCGGHGGAIYLDSISSTISLYNNIFSENNEQGLTKTNSVFNKGTYGNINNNLFYGKLSGTKYESEMHPFVEWKAFKSNIYHTDTDPLHLELRLSKNNADLNKVVRATLCYIKSDGSILPNGPNGKVSFRVPENINIKSQGTNQNGTYIDFTSTKAGSFDIKADLYKQHVIKKINFVGKELIDPELTIKVDNVTEGSNATITITTNNTFNGEVTVIINNKTYSVSVTNGTGTYNIPNLKAGNYTATVISKQTNIFKASTITFDFTVKKRLADPKFDINVGEVIEGSNVTITISIRYITHRVNVTVIIGDKNYTVPVIDGSGSCNIPGLKAGNYTATVISKQTDKFQATNKTTNFTVKSKETQTLIDPELNIKVDNITEGSNATILINTNKTYNGEVTVIIGDKNYTVALVNGIGSCNISDLKAGNYTATVILKQTDKFQATNKTTNFTVKSKETQTLIDPELNIKVDNITEGSNATILIKVLSTNCQNLKNLKYT